MGTGSAFMHGQNTYMGRLFDNTMISLVAYIAHQMCIKDLPIPPNAH